MPAAGRLLIARRLPSCCWAPAVRASSSSETGDRPGRGATLASSLLPAVRPAVRADAGPRSAGR